MKKFALILFLFLLSMPFVSAAVNLGTNPFKPVTSYAPSALLGGKINISLQDEPANSSVFTSIGSQQIELIDFLSNSGQNFNCSSKNCADYYDILGSAMTEVNLVKGTKTIGVLITARSIEFAASPLSLEIVGSSTDITYRSPTKIDILNDNNIDWQYLEASGIFGYEIISTCYNDTLATSQFFIDSVGICQPLKLPPSSKFKLKAMVRKAGIDGNLKMFLYDKETERTSEECDLPEPTENYFVAKECSVNFTVHGERNYFVCLRDDESDYGYQTKGETTSPCGYKGVSADIPALDAALSAVPAAIAPFNKKIFFNETVFSEISSIALQDYIQNYASSKYDNDCTKGCVIPIKIETDVPIKLRLSLRYSGQGLPVQEETSFYTITKWPSLITMNYALLDIEAANFSAPSAYGNHTFDFYIGAKQIGTQEIAVLKVPLIKNVFPISVPAATPTYFYVSASSPENLTLTYRWDFGDGKSEETTSSTVRHTYSTIGEYILTVKATDSKGQSAVNEFIITVGTAKEIANYTLIKKKNTLEEFSKKIKSSTLQPWQKTAFENALSINTIKNSLADYEKRYAAATTDSEYTQIMSGLTSLVIPESFFISQTVNEFTKKSSLDTISPVFVSETGGGDYPEEQEEEYKKEILAWQEKNIAVEISGQTIAVKKDNKAAENVLTFASIKATPSEDVSNYYLIIINEDIGFAKNYGQQNLEGAFGLALSESADIEITLLGRADIAGLQIFASPPLSDIEIIEIECNSNGICEKELGENSKNCRQDCKPWGMGIFFFILLIAIFVGVLMLLKWWYATRYEAYLFKNRQDLTNLKMFIETSLAKKKSIKDIKQKLKKAGWTSEQIGYALDKIKK